MQNFLDEFNFCFKIKFNIFLGKIKLPNSNSTEKTGTQLCNPAAGGVRRGLLRNLLVQMWLYYLINRFSAMKLNFVLEYNYYNY